MSNLERFNPFIKNKNAYRINSSITKHKGEIYCVYRSTHLYGYQGANWLVKLNSNFKVLSVKFLAASNNNPAYEDVRLISFGDVLFTVYTYLPFVENKWEWKFGVGFGIIDVDSGILKNQISLRRLDERYHNKNWIPYIYEQELFLISDFQPFLRILKVFSRDGILVLREDYLAHLETKKWEYGEIRGGTPLVLPPNVKSSYVYGFVHSYLENYNGYIRYYFYTAVRLNPRTKALDYYALPIGEANDEIDKSFLKLWNLSTKGDLKVIFPMGIMNHKNGFYVSFGVDDISSKLKFFEWNYIIKLFE